MIRTDPDHNASLGKQSRLADEALLQGVQQEVLDFEKGAEPVVEVPKTAQEEKRIDSRSVLKAGEPRTVITAYKEAIIDGKLYRVGDTVLVMGESPLQAAQGESKSKKTKTRSSSEDDEDETVEDDDVDAAFEKELRRERASKPSTLSDVTVPWFARIVHFFYEGKDRTQLCVHLDWFHHRRATMLGRVAHARALAYADECVRLDGHLASHLPTAVLMVTQPRQDSIPADLIIRKIDVKRVKADEQIPESGFYYECASLPLLSGLTHVSSPLQQPLESRDRSLRGFREAGRPSPRRLEPLRRCPPPSLRDMLPSPRREGGLCRGSRF
jgi:hypothetical protein